MTLLLSFFFNINSNKCISIFNHNFYWKKSFKPNKKLKNSLLLKLENYESLIYK